MKRKILALLLFLCLFLPAVSFAVDATAVLGTVERFKNADGKYVMAVVPITFTANSGTAAEATYSLVPSSHNLSGWYLLDVYTDPGSTGPTNGAWDLDITNAAGFLVSQNLIDDRSSTATQRVAGVSLGYPTIWSTWSITIGDNAVNSAVATVYLIFVAP